MSGDRILVGLKMILKMLFRRRIVILLIAVIPVVFLSVVDLTSSNMLLPFRLASLTEASIIQVPEKGISIVFFAVASAGFLVSFLALNLIQRNNEAGKRLVISGYHPVELLIANLLSICVMIVLIAIYVGILTKIFYPINHMLGFIWGLVLIGFVYGCYGLAVGSLIKGELEGILFILLLVNIDAGWLQNPVFYAQAQNQEIIRYLPAYFPSQAAIISAFTDFGAMTAHLNSLLYGLVFLGISVIIFYYRMRIKR